MLGQLTGVTISPRIAQSGILVLGHDAGTCRGRLACKSCALSTPAFPDEHAAAMSALGTTGPHRALVGERHPGREVSRRTRASEPAVLCAQGCSRKAPGNAVRFPAPV